METQNLSKIIEPCKRIFSPLKTVLKTVTNRLVDKTIDLLVNKNGQKNKHDLEHKSLSLESQQCGKQEFNPKEQYLSRRKEWLTFLNVEMNSENGVLGLLNIAVSSVSRTERITYLEYYRRKMVRIAGTYNEKFPENNERTPEDLFRPYNGNEYEVIYRNLLKLENEVRYLMDETTDFNKAVDLIRKNIKEDVSDKFVCSMSEYYGALFQTIEEKTDQISDQEK